MPLPMKTLKEAAIELGMSEAEIKTLVNLGKVRAVIKKGAITFAPDELAKMKRLRKTVPESAKSSAPPPPVATPKPPTRPTMPRKPPPPPR